MEICLGTAQFGFNYGITNKKGKTNQGEIRSILKLANESKINLIDTAQSYGESEEAIGANYPDNENFRIISKFYPNNNTFWDKNSQKVWDLEFHNSLKKLRTKTLDGFLLHKSSDLKRKDSKYLFDWLLSLKKRNLVKRVGISIYTSYELLNIDLSQIDLIQLPLSLYDQRLLKDGTIESLNKKGIAIHARSIFMQGLLLIDSSDWPKSFSKSFVNHHAKYKSNLQKINSTFLEGALFFIKKQESLLEAALIGITTTNELKGIIKTWSNINKKEELNNFNTSEMSWDRLEDIDARKWIK